MIDLSGLALELKLLCLTKRASVLIKDDKLMFANEILHKTFKSASMFLNGVQVENIYFHVITALL